MTLGALEALLILSIVLLLIGPRRITALGRSLGRSIRDFRLEFSKQDKKEELSRGEDGEKPPRKG